MIQILSTRYQKRTALFLLLVFYSSFAVPAIARILHPSHELTSFYIGSGMAIRNNHFKKYDWTLHGRNSQTVNSVGTQKKQSAPEKVKRHIGGPGQPETSSFKSVNANDMVDLFSGDFSYNIPLMDVGGYPVNIHYSSGVSMDQEASWVGLGWNINPGTIGRSMRGLPDDFNGTDTISKTQSIKDNRTIGVNIGADIETVGTPLTLGASTGLFHNTYNGWGVESAINASINAGSKSSGPLSGGLSITNNSQNGITISPSLGVKLLNNEQGENGRINLGLSTNYNSRSGMSALLINGSVRMEKLYSSNELLNRAVDIASHPSATISFAVPSFTPYITMPYTSTNFSFRGKIGGSAIVLHPTPFIEGYVSKQTIKPEDKIQQIPATGYLYYSNANNKPNTVLDFNRDRDQPFNAKTTPHIAIPQYTYDVYSISGEGTGGMFRPYRGDVGYIRDYRVRTKSNSDRFSIDLGFGTIFHGGADFAFTNSFTENGSWNSNNDLNKYIKFLDGDTTFQAVYFRNPGEKTTNAQSYYAAVGDDALIRAKLTGSGTGVRVTNAFQAFKNGNMTAEIPVTTTMAKKQRDKRSQVISYLTAIEAARFGLDRTIISYKENTIPIIACNDTVTIISRVGGVRRGHHLSEISVLNGDGRRYVYGTPVYNVEQKEVTFSVEPGSTGNSVTDGLVSYTAQDNSVNNTKGKEGLYTKDSMPAFAHSFLLSGILSPDYVDIKGDGVSSDDIGDAIKFNYSRIYGNNNTYFEWRTPDNQNTASYSEGLKTYSRDDKGSYLYGKKEVWYLNSVESKTMVAVFKLAADRTDIVSVLGENGGRDNSKPARRLKQIDLYAKADLVKNGVNARPIKTVHFAYSYSLCKRNLNDANSGKLTLDSLWFSYNGNEKGKRNPYRFRYHPAQSELNPNYNPKHYDRWGNYKDPSTNPGGLSNSDYPYAEQNTDKAAKNAGAWNLSEIQLPSGGQIKVSYESDDYGFVQHKRATRFFTLAGVSSSQTVTNNNSLYNKPDLPTDFDYVFINSPVALSKKADVSQYFLEGNEYIYFKLAVQMPGDRWGSGVEFVPVYAQVEDFDLVDANKFWLKLKRVGGQRVLARSALQFLRLHLPSKAYPNSEPGDNISLATAVKMLATSFPDMIGAVKSFTSEAKDKGYCRYIDLTRSFVRLNEPNYRKLGGGHRVKRVEIWDNWKKMTGQSEAVYGQEYSYTKIEKIHGVERTISSGVASYEPMIGAEENPFRAPIPYAEKIAPLAPVNNLFAEEPLGESFYPSATVGYSQVRVRTINAKAKSANGWQETEFYTSRDFPTIVENTILNPDSKKSHNPVLKSFLRLNTENYINLSQGFKIELNDMNGKVKAQASYAESDSIHPISYVRNFYKVDNDSAYQKHLNNTVWVTDSLNGHINPRGVIGKDIEIIQDMREQLTKTYSDNKSANLEFFVAGIWPIFIGTLLTLPQREETRFRSAATVKVIQRYGILDSVVAMDKGSIVSTKNLVYDGETGEVVLSRTNNEFNDPVYNFSYPAHWAYSGMGMAYKNIDAIFKNITLVRGKMYYAGTKTPFPMERFFESGDELQLDGYASLASGVENCLSLIPWMIPYYGRRVLPKGWIVDASKAKEGKKGLFVYDEQGNPISGEASLVRILRSGKRNMLDASVGSIVSLKSPIKEIGPYNYKIQFDTTTSVINTSAVTYKDFWKVTNSQYQVDTCYSVIRDTTVYLDFSQNVLLRTQRTVKGSWTVSDEQLPYSWKLMASFDYVPKICNFEGREYRSKAILNFDLQNLPNRPAITAIHSAAFIATPTYASGVWENQQFDFRCVFADFTTSNHNWNDENRTAGGTYTSVLKRIQGPWTANTKYLDFNTSTQNQTTISMGTTSGTLEVNCTNLISDILVNNKPYYGLMFELQNPAQKNGAPHFYSLSGNYKIGPPPMLRISYRYQKDTCVKLCKNYITDTTNPYRWGILGNWRVDRAYTFYSDRKENDASLVLTNIRKEGELKAFAPFWKFTDSILLQLPDTAKWVWNSASSLYNKKGFEIENYDPLGRYNAGLYGYNSTLPVAVAQNSKYREMLYDGFEDYNYKTRECVNCPPARDADFAKDQPGVWVTDTTSHTGNYSLKITAGKEAKITVPVTVDTTTTDLSLNIVETEVYDTTVIGKGNGLTATYSGGTTCITSLQIPTNSITQTITEEGPIDFNWALTPPFSFCKLKYGVSWKGKLQVPITDNYRFYTTSDKTLSVYVNGRKMAESINNFNEQGGNESIRLYEGQLYTIEIRYTHFGTDVPSFVKLRWAKESNPGFREVIPKQFLYKQTLATQDTVGSILSSVRYLCYSPSRAKTRNIIKPAFSPIKEAKMVIGAWVKMDGNDCNTAPALDNVVISTEYNNWGSPNPVSLKRTGVRIEGWQRYEAVITTGFYAAQLKLSVVAPADRNIYVDDIRVQPFNSHMKSFAYDQISLKLMAELDENNYATFYEYDDDGTLIRVKKETEKGIMTIKESRSALLKDN
jgi:hypothetical protein